ncbi:SAM-dependent methyltransferase [Streptacidiphilus jiangxiensis]|uniref:Methyltransferase domain-containing protein n=1 Tax=Streptacidiphilus jiangxiensis TaxID=235985 RepID=A0A1H7QJ86_STRJI|nr:hypothetical protein SAMN05414137_10962 [Streptacidiphilus jiangxiensis]
MVTSGGPADWLEVNRANWDARVPIHTDNSSFYDIPGFVAGGESLRPHEPGEVGDVRGKTLLHLMCHLGLDTLSWARRGATVTGLDFSQPAVDFATASPTGSAPGPRGSSPPTSTTRPRC